MAGRELPVARGESTATAPSLSVPAPPVPVGEAPRPATLPAVGLLPPGLLPPDELPVGLSAADAPPWPFRAGTLPPGLLPPEELPSARPDAGARTSPVARPLPVERPSTGRAEALAEPSSVGASPAEPPPVASALPEATGPESAPRAEAAPDAEDVSGAGAVPEAEDGPQTEGGAEAEPGTASAPGAETVPAGEAAPATELTPDNEAAPATDPIPDGEAPPPTQPPTVHHPTYIGHRPPTYAAEPVALPVADPAALGELVPDTVLDGAQYGSLTLRAVSQRGDSARYRGTPRRDALLLARFGTGAHSLILAAVASGPAVGDPRAAHDACAWIGGAVARSCTRLVEDLRTDHRSALRSGLQRLADRGYGKLRARTAGPGGVPESPAAVRCLLLPADPACRTRVFFGVGEGGFLRLRDGVWEDLEPSAPGQEEFAPHDGPSASGHRPSAGVPAPPGSAPGLESSGPRRAPGPAPFLFTTVTGRRGDALLLCSAGLAEPLADEPALAAHLATDFSGPQPPGLTSFLASAQVRVKGHARDRTAVGVWDT